MLHDSVHNTIIRVRPLMVARNPLKPRIARNPQSDSIPWPKFLQLGHHAVGDDRRGFGVQAVHHRLDQLELLLDAEVDEVGVDEDGVGGAERFVVLEEEGGGDLGARAGAGQLATAVGC